MRALTVSLTFLAAALTLAASLPCDATDGDVVVAYRAEPWEAGGPVAAGTSAELARIVTARCAHAGFTGVVAEAAKDGAGIVLRVPKAWAAQAADVRHLAERRGDVWFRARANGSLEDKERDRRLNEGAAPPEGFAWVPDASGPVQALVETPEAPLAAKLAAAATPEARAAAELEYRRVVAESVFGNADVGEASVRRSISTWGAQALPRVAVRFELREERRAAFEKFTGSKIGRALCIVVEGTVHVAPVIKSAVPGAGEIVASGPGYTDTQASEMAAILACGALPLRLVAEAGK